MIRRLRRRWARRRVEQAFVRGGAVVRVTGHRQRLDEDGDAREYHDRLHAPWRELSPDGVSPFEIDEVGAWLAQSLHPAGAGSVVGAPAKAKVGTITALAIGAVALVAGLWWVRADVGEPDPVQFGALVADASGWTARGDAGDGGALALEVLCGPQIHFARPAGCGLDEELTFAFRLAPSFQPGTAGPGGRLVLFGLDEAGDTLYYAPTPAPDPAPSVPLATALGAGWQGAGFGVRLAVNHVPGRVRVYGLWTRAQVGVEDIDTWAERLRRDHHVDHPAAASRWAEAAGLIGTDVCPSADACADAWIDLRLTASSAAPTSRVP